MKNFYSFFPNAKNVHLLKDVGMIPFLLQKMNFYNSVLVCYDTDEYTYLTNEVEGLKIEFIERKFGVEVFDSVWFLFRNCRKIDVLQLYHADLKSLILSTLFKLLKKRKNAKTYVKLDADDTIFKLTTESLKKNILKLLSRSVDLMTVETTKNEYFLNHNNIFGKKVFYVPNGFYDFGRAQHIEFEDKKNLFVTVGRIGTKQKATEILCEAFMLFNETNQNWYLEIIGPIEEDFIRYIDSFFDKYPFLREKVIFTGNISSKIDLDQKYKLAKIFILPSRYESFGLVYLEAMKAGCFVISSDITPACDITDNERLGKIFPVDDINSLAKTMLEVSSGDKYLNTNRCNLIQKFVYERYYWPNIVAELYNLIENE